jgi:phenylalanyl-tRNA synthetase beta subunit
VLTNQRRGHSDARFFEIGLCFDGVEANKQSNKLAGIVSGNRFNASLDSLQKQILVIYLCINKRQILLKNFKIKMNLSVRISWVFCEIKNIYKLHVCLIEVKT